MNVLEVSYSLAPPVGPDAVGGAEQVLSLVDEALVRAGHRCVVVAPEGSRVAGALVPAPLQPGPWDLAARARAERAHETAIGRALAAFRVDLLHLHGLDFGAFLRDGRRAVVSLHLPPELYSAESLLQPRGEARFVCVSDSQAGALPPSVHASVLPNGVPLATFRPDGAKERFGLVLARICREKGIAPALAAAREAALPLLVCGRAFPYPVHVRYLEEEVLPLLDGERRFLGPVGLARKARLLARARCLVVPSLVPETSSLVAMEALASGTPVVARRIGALPEIVEDGRTGFLVDRDEELAPAIREAGRLSPAACRRAAELRFSARAAARRWVAFLERAARPRPRARPPRPGIEVERHVGLGALEALRAEWSALCDRAAAAPFQRPEWLLPYCRAFGVAEPRAVALRAHGRLVGLAPLVAWREDGRRLATLLGAGLSDYQDALLEPACEPGAAARLVEEVLRLFPDVEAVRLEHLPEGGVLHAAAADRAPAPEPDGSCPVLALPEDAAGLDRLLAPGLRADVRYGRRRLARSGARVTRATDADLDRHLDALFALHAARWEARGEPGVLAAPAIRRFHAEAARGLLARGVLRLDVLWVDHGPAAATYGFLDGGRWYHYLGGFAPALKGASPGAVSIAHAAEAAIAEGARELDFLRGREPYKYRWGARDRSTFRCLIAPRR